MIFLIIEFTGCRSTMELLKLPVDVIKVVLFWAGSRTRSKMCSVSKNMYGWILELSESNPIVREYYATKYTPIPPVGYPISDEHIIARRRMYTIAGLGDYHLFMRLYTKKDVEYGNRIVGHVANGGNIDLLLLIIDKMIPHCVIWEDYFAAGSGGNRKCIEMVLKFEHVNSYLAVACGAAAGGHINVVRDMIPRIPAECSDVYIRIVNFAIVSLEFGLDIIKMIEGEFKIIIPKDDLLYHASDSIKLTNMSCLQYFMDKGAVPKLTVASSYGNTLALDLLISKGSNDYVDAFNVACCCGRMKFVVHMLEKYVKSINIHAGFTKLNVTNRIEFMEACLKLEIKFNADLWFKETYCIDDVRRKKVCKWMLDHPSLKISDVLRK